MRYVSEMMKIYRVTELPHGYDNETIGTYMDGVAHVKKNLPIPIQIVVILHEVGHHFSDKLIWFLFNINAPLQIISCITRLWVLFFEKKDELICRRWLPKNPRHSGESLLTKNQNYRKYGWILEQISEPQNPRL